MDDTYPSELAGVMAHSEFRVQFFIKFKAAKLSCAAWVIGILQHIRIYTYSITLPTNSVKPGKIIAYWLSMTGPQVSMQAYLPLR
jgi:hypothetical protein